MKYKIAEQVGRGHPDKVADLISDLVLKQAIAIDPNAKVAIETLIKDDEIRIAGEVTLNKADFRVDLWKLMQELKLIDEQYYEYTVWQNISTQSPEINKQVDLEGEIGAGDQGIMIGYACNESSDLLPLEMSLANHVMKYLDQRFILKDSKVQVVLETNENNKLLNIHHIHVAQQTKLNLVDPFFDDKEKLLSKEIKQEIQKIIKGLMEVGKLRFLRTSKIEKFTMVTFEEGGAKSDAGVTGRKIVADAYGPRVPVGGGAFSGKDFSKVDRTGAYFARYIATHWLKYIRENWPDWYRKVNYEVIVKIGYVIGNKTPLFIDIETFNNGKLIEPAGLDSWKLSTEYEKYTIKQIIELLNLKDFDPINHDWKEYCRYYKEVS